MHCALCTVRNMHRSNVVIGNPLQVSQPLFSFSSQEQQLGCLVDFGTNVILPAASTGIFV